MCQEEKRARLVLEQAKGRQVPGAEADLRWTIILHFFQQHGEPDDGTEAWCTFWRNTKGVLELGAGVDAVIRRAVKSYKNTGLVHRQRPPGRKPVLNDSEQDRKWLYLFYVLERHGCPEPDAARIVNAVRLDYGEATMHHETYRRAMVKLLEVKFVATVMKKQGSTDPESAWAKARLLFAQQLIYQLSSSSIPRSIGVRRLTIYCILWTDEKHMQQIIGYLKNRVPCMPADESGQYLAFADGGEMDPPRSRINLKYPGEGRLCIGFAVVLVYNSVTKEYVPVVRRMRVFDYTGRMIVAPARYDAYKEILIKRANTRNPTGPKWASSKAYPKNDQQLDALAGGRYQAAFPDTWQAVLKADADKALCDIRDLIDHLHAEGQRIFAGTPHADDWCLMHDALSSLTSNKGMEYLHEKLGDRFLGCSQAFAESLGKSYPKQYLGRMVGDSPELDPCDTHAFAHLVDGTLRNWAGTFAWKDDRPGKFRLDTPRVTADALTRTFMSGNAPTDEQILADVCRIPRTLRAVVDARGCRVDEIALRHGRRGRIQHRLHPLAAQGTAELLAKLRQSVHLEERAAGASAQIPAAPASSDANAD